jgi:hypothetical protein
VLTRVARMVREWLEDSGMKGRWLGRRGWDPGVGTTMEMRVCVRGGVCGGGTVAMCVRGS